MQPMYYIGLDVHKQKISYCVKDSSGKIYAEGWIPATRFDLDRWMKTLPQPWSAAMEATMFSGWIYDHLKPHAAELKVAHPLMLRAIALIALTALAMGTRNAAVRKLAIPDLTTTVLTLTITGIGADSSLANGNNPRLARRVASVVAMFLGAAMGAVIIHYSISAALWLGTAISALCSAALFRSLRTSDSL